MTTGVVLLNMGGPQSTAAVRPFLEQLFSDPAILPLPRAVRLPLARWIARMRASRVVPRYERIGGRSPLVEITRAQARALEQELSGGGGKWHVEPAMRYTPPRAAEALARLRERGAERLVVLPLYPQYSEATTGSSLLDLDRALTRAGMEALPRAVVRSWHDHPGYADALAESVRETLADLSDPVVLFSAHSLPERAVRRGDPYPDHVRATVEAVRERLPRVRWRLAFQSRAGPVRWIGPGVEQTLGALAREGCGAVVVVPVSFVSDHIETLYEIDVEYRALAERLGIGVFRRVPALNTRPSFIRALADIVRTARTRPGRGR